MMKVNPEKPFFFFDEARFGTHSKLGHGWFRKGERTPVKVKLGFKNFYVYSAVDVRTGNDFSLILPKVNTKMMNDYLSEFSKFLGDTQAVMIIDGAAWHKSKTLIIPSNIQILYLPPRSPELNPIEKLWQYMKSHTIKNKIYESLADLEQAICDFVKSLSPTKLRQTCSINHCLN
jgi:transposase